MQGPFGVLSGLDADLMDELVPIDQQKDLPGWVKTLFDRLDDSPDFHIRGPRCVSCRSLSVTNYFFSRRESHEIRMTPQLKEACLEIAHRRKNLYGSGEKRNFWTTLQSSTVHDGLHRPELESIQEVF